MANRNFFSDVRSLPGSFWYLNIIQMLEKFAYGAVLLQLPVYLSQKDAVGGLHWDQSVKGWIFLSWALVQNLTPLFAGGYADRIGYKKALFLSFLFVTAGYFLFGAASDVWLFAAGAVILGLGLGVFKPTLQASISSQIAGSNESLGWGIYFMLYNFAVFLSGFFSVWMKSFSWQHVFWGSAAVFSMNFLLLFFFPAVKRSKNQQIENKEVVKEIFRGLFERKVLWFVLIMSGFAFIFMQFYETYSNFLVDWSDTSPLVNALSLPEMFTMKLPTGTMVAYEWMINLNSVLIILFVAGLSWLMARIPTVKAIIAGMILCTCGMAALGSSTLWYAAAGGIVIYTFGEMIVNPRFTEYLSMMAPTGSKARYMSYLNISFAFGFAGGALSGGYFYRHLGEKAVMAADYLQNHGFSGAIDPSSAFLKMTEMTGLSPQQANTLLWESYHPWQVWIPFIAVGIATVTGLLLYYRKFSQEPSAF